MDNELDNLADNSDNDFRRFLSRNETIRAIFDESFMYEVELARTVLMDKNFSLN